MKKVLEYLKQHGLEFLTTSNHNLMITSTSIGKSNANLFVHFAQVETLLASEPSLKCTQCEPTKDFPHGGITIFYAKPTKTNDEQAQAFMNRDSQ